ncbi:MAG: hypothetical protein IH991_21235 [Planctomycetes bacterium]|nr:hypothetical protein [Planctomycetota bacterium]
MNFVDRFIIERNMGPGADLFDNLNVFNEQQVVARRDAEPADLGVSIITQEQQLRPGGWAEAE